MTNRIEKKLGWTLPDPSQDVMPGVAPVSLRERLEWQGQQPLRASAPQKSLDVGFWDPLRDQIEMF